MKKLELKKMLGEIISEEILNRKDLVGPYTVYVKTGKLSGQTVMANLNKNTGIYYYLNPDTGHDEPIGDEKSVDVQKKKMGEEINEIQRESVGYWIDLDGRFNKVPTSHRDFAGQLLKKDPNLAFEELLNKGWVRARVYHAMGLEVEYKRINPTQKRALEKFAEEHNLHILKPGQGGHVEEGVGYVYAKDRAKDPKSIKKNPDAEKSGGNTKHWIVKFQSASDLKKHGNTEKSPVTETMNKNEVKTVIRELIDEMWADIATGGKEKKGPTGRGTEAGADEPFVSLYKGGSSTGGANVFNSGKGEGASEMLPSAGGAMSEAVDDFELGKQKAIEDFKNKIPYKKNPVGMSGRWIQGYKFAYGTLRRAASRGTPTQPPVTPEKDSQSDFGLEEVTMPHSQQTPPDTMALWKLIEQLEVGQSINFYNPKNPNPNTTAPWVYIKKILTTDSGGEEAYGFNLSIEPRMDWKPTSGVLQGMQNVETGEDVTEDEVSVALEIVERNRNVLSMYYVETEDAPRKRKPYQGDPDHDIGDYERFGPDQIRAQDVTEGKQMNEKREMLRSLIREAIQEVHDEDYEYQEQQEKQSMKRIQSYAHWVKANLQKQPAEIAGVVDHIVKEIDGLVSAHDKGEEVSNVNLQAPSTTATTPIKEEAPAGWEGTVKAMKKHKDIDNPWALSHWMKNKGYKSHKKA